MEPKIEQVSRRDLISKVSIAEFWWEHQRLCFAFTMRGKPYIQVQGGQMDLEKAAALRMAMGLAEDWLLGQKT